MHLAKALKFCTFFNDLLSKPNGKEGSGEPPVDLDGKNLKNASFVK